MGRMHEVSHQKNNLDCHAPFGRSQGRAYPSASRKTTFWDKRTPPLQEKRRFETSGPLRFKKNDVLGRAAPSASLLQSGNFKIYSFFICLLNEKMTSITKIKAIALTKLNNAEYGAFMDS